MLEFNQQETNKTPFWRSTSLILLLILLLAAFLRLYKLTQSPPGLNQDEAISAWPAYCLLKTGKDNAGQSWPIYYMRGLGGNNPTLFTYLTIPFQAIGGLNIYTTRLPAVFAGVFMVWLVYLTTKKLFDTETALAAAALLAVTPWHLLQSRWGHEASITPLLGFIPLAGMVWANLPIGNNFATSRPVIAAISGILAGVGCFGYQAVRLFVPAFIFTLILFNLPLWWKTIKTKKGALAVALFIFGFVAVWGQLIYLHIFYPEGIGKHAIYQTQWIGSVPLAESLKNVPLHYIKHYGLKFLFCQSDDFIFQGPPVGGQFHWYELPLILIGGFVCLRKFTSSASLRTIAAFVLAFPAGDSLGWETMSTLRSASGFCAMTLLAAVGLTTAAKWLRKQNTAVARPIIIIFLLSVFVFNARFIFHFFGEYNRRSDVYHNYHADLVEACKWLKPHFNDFDAIYITTDNLNMPYVITTVVLGYDPKKWFSEPVETANMLPGSSLDPQWDYYTRYGKMHFIYDYSDFSISKLQEKFTSGRTLFILRPNEFIMSVVTDKLKELEKSGDEAAANALVQKLNLDRPDTSLIGNLADKIIHKIYDPDGEETLWLCRF
jgi:4-amino-4-deoxy-L-arabinose transferase-like glycosyltransferase